MSDAIVDAVAAGVGSASSKLVTFPFDLLKTRMAMQSSPSQTVEVVVPSLAAKSGETSAAPKEAPAKKKSNDMVSVATDIIEREGVPGLYRGVGPKIVKSVTGKVLYYFIYRLLSDAARASDGSVSPRANFLVGYLSEVLELPVIMPLESIATRAQSSKGKSYLELYEELSKEGKLFASLDAYIIGALQPAIQNTVFDQLKARFARSLSAFESFFLGLLASSIAITITYPLDLARTLNQGPNAKKNATFVEIWKDVVEEKGVGALWSGVGASLAQGGLSAAIMLMIKDKISVAVRAALLGKAAEVKKAA